MPVTFSLDSVLRQPIGCDNDIKCMDFPTGIQWQGFLVGKLAKENLVKANMNIQKLVINTWCDVSGVARHEARVPLEFANARKFCSRSNYGRDYRSAS